MSVPGWRGAGRMPLVVLVFGLAAVAMLLLSDRVRQRAIVRSAAWLNAVADVQTHAAVSHLWLEELVTGDEVDIAELFGRLDRALALTDAMLGNVSLAEDLPPPLGDAALRRDVSALRADVVAFRDISRERRQGLATGLPVGIGSAIDVEYDAVFERLLARAERLEAALAARREAGEARSGRLVLAIVVGWLLVVALAAAGLWQRERRRQWAEADLARSQEHLLQSQKLEAVGRLAGGLAHDINNYLAAIRSHCELVRRKRHADDPVAVKMDRVVATVKKASTLIDRLLAFSRRREVHPIVVNLNRVVRGLVKMLAPSLGEAVRLETRLANDLWNVEIDLPQIEQLLVNLLVNARDALAGGGRVEVRTANLPATDEVEIIVADDGAGIPAEHRDKIFEPFWTTKTKKGSGLGLATAYAIARQAGGRIEVASDLGEGTRFHVVLPRCRHPEAGSAAVAEIPVDADLEGDERILLVDDSEDFRDATEALLSALGYRVTVAADGDAALRLFAADDDFDLVLTDLVMPGLGGGELVERLCRRRPVKAIFMSGHSDEVISRHGLDADAVTVRKQQMSSTLLARSVRQLLDQP